MWVVAKYKINEFNFLHKNLVQKVGKNLKYYSPKIKIKKNKNNRVIEQNKNIIDDYIFFYHESFKNINFLKSLKNMKGLKYFLNNCTETQDEIIRFIKICKDSETEGFLNQKFFDFTLKEKAKFISGPFSGFIFKIIKKQGNKTKVLLGNLSTTIDFKSEHIFSSV